jgi:hypothetical protein
VVVVVTGRGDERNKVVVVTEDGVVAGVGPVKRV